MRQQSATLTHHTTHNQLMASAFPCSPNEPTQSLRKCPRFRSEKAHAVKHERNCSCCVAMSERGLGEKAWHPGNLYHSSPDLPDTWRESSSSTLARGSPTSAVKHNEQLRISHPSVLICLRLPVAQLRIGGGREQPSPQDGEAGSLVFVDPPSSGSMLIGRSCEYGLERS